MPAPKSPEAYQEWKGKLSQRLKGKKLSKEHRTKISNTLRGRKLSDDTKRKLSESENKGKFVKGHVPLNKHSVIIYCKYCGKPREISPSRVGRVKYCSNTCYQKDLELHRVRKTCPVCSKEFILPTTKTTRRFCSRTCLLKGIKLGLVTYNPWLKGKSLEDVVGKENANNICKKISDMKKGKRVSPRTEFKKGNTAWWMERQLPNLAYIYGEKRPTKPELKLIEQIKERNLPLSYVGNEELKIGCLNPDFIATNGERKVVEVFGCYWHGCPAHYPRVVSPIKREKNRRAYYHREGYDLFVMWEHDLESEQIMERMEEWLF